MTQPLHCSFCSRSESQVRRLVAGHGGGHICDECVSIAARIIEHSDAGPAAPGAWQRMRAWLRAAVRARRSSSLLRATAA